MERTTLLLPPDLRERAGLLARSRGQSLAELIRVLLERELATAPADPNSDPLFTDDAAWVPKSGSVPPGAPLPPAAPSPKVTP
jgi:hypothetical protein